MAKKAAKKKGRPIKIADLPKESEPIDEKPEPSSEKIGRIFRIKENGPASFSFRTAKIQPGTSFSFERGKTYAVENPEVQARLSRLDFFEVVR